MSGLRERLCVVLHLEHSDFQLGKAGHRPWAQNLYRPATRAGHVASIETGDDYGG